MPKGGRYWRLKYRFGGKEKVLALGVYPEVSLAEAREKRAVARKMLEEGIDPSSAKRDNRQLAAAANACVRFIIELEAGKAQSVNVARSGSVTGTVFG